MEKLKFSITGMGCAACQAKVRRIAEGLPGVSDVEVSLLLNSMTLALDESSGTTAQAIVDAVTEAGYGAALAEGQGAPKAAAEAAGTAEGEAPFSPAEAAAQERNELKRRLKQSLFFLIPLMVLAMHEMLHLPRFLCGRLGAMLQLLMVMGIMGVNGDTLRSGVAALRRLSPDMSTLATLGCFCALFYSFFRIELGGGWFFDAAGMILTIFTLGRYLESHAKARSCGALTALLEMTPRQATVLRNGAESTVPISQVVAGEVVIVHPGEAVPVDGTVLSGRAFVDQAALTGEPMPVEKQAGDKVHAATLDTDGVLQVRAEAVGEETALAEIIRMVTAASASRAPIARIADRVCAWFVPAVIALALLTLGGWLAFGHAPFGTALLHAIAVLVISCPCAMGLATPVAIMVGTGRAAQMGILFKSAEMMQRLAESHLVVLDKTGTLTAGRPVLAEIRPQGGREAAEVLSVAASLEAPSRHPIAAAFRDTAAERLGAEWKPMEASELRQLPGRGLEACLAGKRWLLGNAALMEERGLAVPEAGSVPPGAAVLYLADESAVAALFLLNDRPRPESAQAVRLLHESGCRLGLLTGDAEGPARAVASLCGFREGTDMVHAGLMPQDKARLIAQMRKAHPDEGTAMVGDGVNDAPALAAADVGLAIGSGTQVAMEAASVVLQRSNLLDVVDALRLSRAVMRNVRENLAWAFGYNILCIPLAAGLLEPWFGWRLTPMVGSAAMACSSLCVILNALRLRNFKPSVPERH